ncbi:GAGA-binding transcriptional activator [Striga asiatica]|uniref:GAGA-binding transcriptional activator n=1 Tax=Striga asiatica TaxID=4170 RepID=A0A5A7R7I6_STRAF|nr:GAGA-binding transcriptional activator [Striga asiatica]
MRGKRAKRASSKRSNSSASVCNNWEEDEQGFGSDGSESWKDNLGMNRINFDELAMNVPVCTCTGPPQPCYRKKKKTPPQFILLRPRKPHLPLSVSAGEGVASAPFPSLSPEIITSPHFNFFVAVLRAHFSRLTFCHVAWILACTVREAELRVLPMELVRCPVVGIRGGFRRAVVFLHTDEPSGSRTGPDGIRFDSWQLEKIESKAFDE